MRLAKFLGALGRICISTGVLILLFVAYQLWGTGIQTAQAQDDLKQDFTTILDNSASTTTLPPGAPSPPPARPIEPTVPGDPMALIVIPKIGVDNIVVEGVSLSNLKKGPGHYPDSPVPGQKGNAAIAGHRTTYGAPFNRLDELTPGDEILVTTVQGRFRYIVSDEDGDGNGNQIVLPSQVEVLQDFGDNRLTLTACHPKYSARQRIVVVGKLAPEVTALAPRADLGSPTPPANLDSIDGEKASALPAVLLGLLVLDIWLVAWILARHWRPGLAYGIGLPFFLVALFFFFEQFSRLLPSNF
jgi:sortase A